MSETARKKIMFSGGGTGGSVTPLLAVATRLLEADPETEIVFVGSRKGIEKEMVAAFRGPRKEKVRFLSVPSGKLRRYWSWRNLTDPFLIIAGFFASLDLLRRERPQALVSAGSFVSVPLVWAGALFRIPILIHQQDIRPGLANKLMAPYARVITVVFDKSLGDYGPRAILAGNPHREVASFMEKRAATRERYGLDDRPLILVFGGGTGAAGINQLVAASYHDLVPAYQVFHLTGQGRQPSAPENAALGYIVKDFLLPDDLLALMAAADLVVSRAGLGALTDIAVLKKAAIIIPMPDSHQEENAAIFAAKEAALVLNQKNTGPEDFSREVRGLLNDPARREALAKNAARTIRPEGDMILAGIIEEMVSPAVK